MVLILTTCLLLKKGRDDSDSLAYRPLSVLNYYQKVVAKMLAIRLGRHISSLIHSDQNGFVSGRFSFFNTRRLFKIMYAKHEVNDKPVVTSLDAERAFDQSLDLLARSVPSQVSSLIHPSGCNWSLMLRKNNSLSALLFSTKDYPLHLVDSFVLQNSIQILKQIKRVLQAPEFSVYSPIWFNHNFITSQSDQAFT